MSMVKRNGTGTAVGEGWDDRSMAEGVVEGVAEGVARMWQGMRKAIYGEITTMI